MNIVVFADSKGMARPAATGDVKYEDTYIYQLAKTLRSRFGAGAPLVLDRSQRSRSLREVWRDWPNEVGLRSASQVIVQVGGADCFPITLHASQRTFLQRSKIRWIGRGILTAEKRLRKVLLRMGLRREMVPLHEFDALVARINRDARRNGTVLWWIGLSPLSPERMRALPGAESNRKAYNAVLRRRCGDGVTYLDLDAFAAKEACLVDGMHFNRHGANLVAETIASHCSKFVYETAGRPVNTGLDLKNTKSAHCEWA